MAPQIAVDAPAPAASPLGQPPAALPKASPSSAPRRRHLLGEGPIVLQGTGTYQLGINRSNRNGLTTSLDNYSTALSLGLERRTEASVVTVSSAFGYGAGGLGIGSMILGYRTPRYGLNYGQVTGPSDSQLQIGGFARGVSLAIPLRNGDISYLASTATQALDRGITYRVYGVRRNWNAFGGFLSGGGYVGTAEQGSGRLTIADFGYRHYGEKLSTDTEVALSNVRGIDGIAAGSRVATAFQADLQGQSLFTTASLRYDPAGFPTLTGALDGGLSASLAFRKHTDRFGDMNLSLGHVDDRLGDLVSHDDRMTLSGGKSWAHFGVQYVLGTDDQRNSGSQTLQRTGALSFTQSLRGFSFFETLQSASTSGTGGSAGQRQIALGVSRQAFGGSLAYQAARSTQAGDASTGGDLSQTFSYHRALGRKLDVSFTQGFLRSNNNGTPSTLSESTISLTRRLSPVVSLQAGADLFRQTGIGGGRGTIFTASLIGPFGFGQPQNGIGRANPNLPAVIRGIVTFSTSPTPFGYNQMSSRGYNNALVILDGKITQRTDSNGEFEFRFVPQGTHTVRIDPATISPGLIADREYATVTVLGGQTSTMQFNVGNFAGVTGSVVAQDQNGQKHPLPGVGIAVDGIQAVMSAPDGHYQVGRLSPGAHTISIVEATVPSTVAFVGDLKRTIAVTAGTSIPLDFVATPLGSIAGSVLAPGDGGFGNLTGLRNVYVVAEPGEHAAITDDDGSFILDNMAPGTYTLTVDPDTIPEGLSVLSGPDGPVPLAGGASLTGIVFKLGAGAKDVVYTFNDGKKQSIQVTAEPASAPPGALLRIRATTNAKDVKALFVESDVFGTFPLRLDPRQAAWTGATIVPQLAKGDYALTVTARRKDVNDGSALIPIDGSIPLFAVRFSPRNPQAGQTAKVTIKSLAQVDDGDAVIFEDGYKVVLPKPVGRVFTFDIRIWRKGLPYSGTLVTKKGLNLPVVLR